MINKNKKIISFILSACIVFSSWTIAFANDLDSKKRELEEVERKINSSQTEIDETKSKIDTDSKNKDILKNEISAISEEADSLEYQINLINVDIQELMNKIYSIEEEIIKTNERIKLKELEIQTLVERIESNTKLLKQRLVVMYKMGDAQKIEILLNSKDINDFLSRNTMMTTITEYDQNLIKSLKTDKSNLDKLLIEFNGQKKVLEINKQNSEKERKNLEEKVKQHNILLEKLRKEESEKYTAMVDLDRKIEEYQKFLNEKLEKQADLSSQKTGIQSEITRIENEIIEREREAQRRAEEESRAQREARERADAEAKRLLEEKRNNLGKIEEEIESNSNATRLAWPTAATLITSPFGWRIDPFGSGATVFHDGLDIAGPAGTPIYAAESGTVTIAGWGLGYGNYIEIDHGNGLKTRYGHLNGFYVSVGQTVSRGQNIAPMGSTGWSTGPHVHFEVIVNGTKVDPLNYIR